MKVFAVKVFFQKTNCSNSNIKLFIAFGKYLIAFNAFLVICTNERRSSGQQLSHVVLILGDKRNATVRTFSTFIQTVFLFSEIKDKIVAV